MSARWRQTFRARRHPMRAFVAELERLPALRRIDLHRFDRAEVSAQLAGMLGEPPTPDLVARVFDRSEGNAFLVEEILGIVRDDGAGRLPPSLRDLLLARTERLSAGAQAVLRAAAATDRVAHGLLAACCRVGSGGFRSSLGSCSSFKASAWAASSPRSG